MAQTTRSETISRNARCTCGSGKKFKHCCLQRQSSSPSNRLLQFSPAPPIIGHLQPPATRSRLAITTPLETRDWKQVVVVLDEPNQEQTWVTLIFSTEWLESRDIVLNGPIPLNIPPFKVRGIGRVQAIEPSPLTPEGEGMTIKCIRTGAIEGTLQPNESFPMMLPLLLLPTFDHLSMKERHWQQVHVVVEEPNDQVIFAVILYSDEWLRFYRVATGGPIRLPTPEQGIKVGRVRLIEPSPMISDGEGRIMTYVHHYGKTKEIAKLCDPKTDPLAEPGVRTFFGERLTQTEDGLARLEFDVGDAKADITLRRSVEWIREYRKLIFPDRSDDEAPLDIDQYRLVRICVDIGNGDQVQIAWFWELAEVKVLELSVDEPMSLRIPDEKICGKGRVVAIDDAPFVPRKGEKSGTIFLPGKRTSDRTMESTEVGDYATTYTDEEKGIDAPKEPVRVVVEVRQRIRFRLEKEDGEEVTGALLRSAEWVQTERVETGGKVYLSLPEQGTIGWADVESVAPILVHRRLGDRHGRMITGTFRHSNGFAGDLKLKGSSESIGVTPGHLFWSVSRKEWVSVGELRVGETVKTIDGTTTVESYTMRGKPEPVYNLEVEIDHCFRVGEKGVLVHNTSAPFDDALAKLPRPKAKWDWDMAPITQAGSNWQPFTWMRVKSMVAIPEIGASGSTASDSTAFLRWIGGASADDAGHVFGRRWGGSGKLKDGNVFPQNIRSNRGEMNKRDNAVERLVENGSCVCIKITLQYDTNPNRPGKILYEAWVNGTQSTDTLFTQPFDNPM